MCGEKRTGCLSKSTGNEPPVEARASVGFWSESVFYGTWDVKRTSAF